MLEPVSPLAPGVHLADRDSPEMGRLQFVGNGDQLVRRRSQQRRLNPNPRGDLPLIDDCRDGVRNGQFMQACPGRSPSSAGRSEWGVPITSFPCAPEACVA